MGDEYIGFLNTVLYCIEYYDVILYDIVYIMNTVKLEILAEINFH